MPKIYVTPVINKQTIQWRSIIAEPVCVGQSYATEMTIMNLNEKKSSFKPNPTVL